LQLSTTHFNIQFGQRLGAPKVFGKDELPGLYVIHRYLQPTLSHSQACHSEPAAFWRVRNLLLSDDQASPPLYQPTPVSFFGVGNHISETAQACHSERSEPTFFLLVRSCLR
jgi:hypothetical protein